MGFLDHSTNNIIVDAVLTDLGRKRLSTNDGSFNIVKFALGDDEVDYSIISTFGLTVGREKIEKNTPIFEAQTSSSLALKHKLLSISSQVEVTLPRLTRTGANTGLIVLPNNGTQVPVTVSQSPATGVATIQPDLTETVLMVRASTRFLTIMQGNETLNPVYATERDRMGIYRVSTRVADGENNRSCVITLKARPELNGNSTIYNTFGDSNGDIFTNVVVTGLMTGSRLNISCRLSAPAT